VQNIYNPENFDRALRAAADFIKSHCDQHKTMPDRAQITAATGIKLEAIPDLNEGHFDWFLEEFEGFTRRQELERAILKSADLLEKGEYAPVEKLIKDAVQISLTRDMGTDYFADPRARLMLLKSNNGQNSTGWPALDRLLYGGFNRGELQIFAGGSGSGKSLFMQNLAVNWVERGLNGVYITLELSEGLCAMRIDGMLTNTAQKEIFRDLDTVEMKVRMTGKKSGKMRIKYMPAQVSPNDLFVKDKYVSEELRNLAKELNILFVTASQLNRAAVEEIEFDHSHISGGISKINTADNVFGIFTSRAMRERGRYQLQLMKTRSSSGVGQKVELEFDIECLRIRDLAEDKDYQEFKKRAPSIYESIKAKSTISDSDPNASVADEPGKIVADVQSSKLKQLLGQIKQNG
jgi:hypothetical protein